MIDMEQTVYDILTTTLPGMKWSVGFPQDFRVLGDGLGSIKQMDNSVRTSTSSGIDRISNVAVQVQVWAPTPERRNELDREIATVLASLGIPAAPESSRGDAPGRNPRIPFCAAVQRCV